MITKDFWTYIKQNPIFKPKDVEPKNELSGNDVDIIVEKTLTDIDLDKQIDFLIDEYIEKLFT